MQFSFLSKAFLASVVVGLVSGLALLGQEPPKELHEAKGVPARATPEDYAAHIKAGAMTLAGEFKGHSVPTDDGVFETEEFVVVEMAMFGAPDSKLKFSFQDFSLRINGKKNAIPAQAYEMVLRSLKDPEWAPPVKEEKSKTGLSTGGSGGDNSPPPVVHMPFNLQRAMNLKVEKASLPEGERPLPLAGLIYFPYHGKEKGINSVELIYAGPAGNATLRLQ